MTWRVFITTDREYDPILIVRILYVHLNSIKKSRNIFNKVSVYDGSL